MTWLIIGGLSCLGVVLFLVLALVALLYYLAHVHEAAERRLRENGTPVLAVVVMANSTFYRDPEIKSAPALVLFSFEPPSEALAEDMRDVAMELFELYLTDEEEIQSLPNYQQQMVKRLQDDSYQPGRRTRVAMEMSLGHVLYMADLKMRRRHVPEHVADTLALACVVSGKEEGRIMVIPFEEEDAQRIYSAVGAEQSPI